MKMLQEETVRSEWKWWKKKGKAKGPRGKTGNGARGKINENGARGKDIVNLLEEGKG